MRRKCGSTEDFAERSELFAEYEHSLRAIDEAVERAFAVVESLKPLIAIPSHRAARYRVITKIVELRRKHVTQSELANTYNAMKGATHEPVSARSE